MKIVKVTYTTSSAYSESNQKNIAVVMKDLKEAGYTGINYNVCLQEDGKTFIHTAFFKSEEDRKLLNDLPAFKYFQEQLKVSVPEQSPRQEWLTLVASSTNIFNA